MEDPRVLAMASSSSSSLCSSSKRAREPTNGTETTTVGWCSVDGFISDLNKCRDYHRRHKVCQVHSKKPTVMIGGREQRFCQQCSRFHLLVEFDEAKRSCRKRLDGHNRRRRKLQLEPFTISSESLLSNHQGQVFVAIQCSTVISHSYRLSMWTGGVKTDDDTKVYIRHQDNNPVLVLQNHPAREVTLGYRFNVIASSQDNELPWVIIQASGKGLDHSITLAQLLVATGLQYNNGLSERYQSPGMKDEPMDSVLGPDTSEPELHSQCVFHMQTKNGSEHVSPDSPRTFPFS